MSRSNPKLLQTVFGCLKKSPKIDCDLNQKNQPLERMPSKRSKLSPQKATCTRGSDSIPPNSNPCGKRKTATRLHMGTDGRHIALCRRLKCMITRRQPARSLMSKNECGRVDRDLDQNVEPRRESAGATKMLRRPHCGPASC